MQNISFNYWYYFVSCLCWISSSVHSARTLTYSLYHAPCWEIIYALFQCLCETCNPLVDCQSMGYYSFYYPGRGTFFARSKEWPRCLYGNSPCTSKTWKRNIKLWCHILLVSFTFIVESSWQVISSNSSSIPIVNCQQLSYLDCQKSLSFDKSIFITTRM